MSAWPGGLNQSQVANFCNEGKKSQVQRCRPRIGVGYLASTEKIASNVALDGLSNEIVRIVG